MTKTYSQKLNNVIGQLQGVQAMLDKGKDCFEVMAQMKASRSAFLALMNQYVRENMQACLTSCKRNGEKDEACKKFLDELLA